MEIHKVAVTSTASGLKWNSKMLVLVKGGKPEYLERNSWSKDKYQQETQPTYDVASGNRVCATLVRGECSHQSTLPASPDVRPTSSVVQTSWTDANVCTLVYFRHFRLVFGVRCFCKPLCSLLFSQPAWKFNQSEFKKKNGGNSLLWRELFWAL